MALNLTEDKAIASGTAGTLMFVGWILSARWPALIPGLPTIVGGLLGCLGVFCGSHVANNWVTKGDTSSDSEDVDASKSPFVEPGSN